MVAFAQVVCGRFSRFTLNHRKNQLPRPTCSVFMMLSRASSTSCMCTNSRFCAASSACCCSGLYAVAACSHGTSFMNPETLKPEILNPKLWRGVNC